MKHYLIAFLVIDFLVFGLVMLLVLRSYQVQNKVEQKEFLSGTVPTALPEGFYKGSVGAIKVSWAGKKFDATNSAGINVFNDNGKTSEAYRFAMYIAKGLQEKDKNVLRIDYSQNERPLWLRFFVDEIVEVAPGKFLGKIHLHVINGFPLTLGLFRLEK